MSDNVHVAYGDDQSQTARDLLEAAEALELDASVVRLDTEHGTFSVPEEVAKKAKSAKVVDPHEAATLEVADAIEARGEAYDPTGGAPLAEPDHKAAAAAVGHIDSGPSAEEADAAQLDANPHTVPAPAKKAAAKRPAAKKSTTAKKAAAKKAPAKKAAAQSKEN